MLFRQIVDEVFPWLQGDDLAFLLFYITPVDDVLGDGGVG